MSGTVAPDGDADAPRAPHAPHALPEESPMNPLLRLIAASALALPLVAGAASHYVRAGATGTATGADWTNAYPKLPATLVRGDTYYLAGGSYGSHVFQDAPSGTATITLVRATNVSHGTPTGWSTTYATGPASFTNWQIEHDHHP
jgi:hypothetical protein